MPALPATGSARAQRSEATRRAILKAAEELLLEGGEAGVSIRGVCARAGVTAPTVYHHFGDRRRLIERVVDDHFAGFDSFMVWRAGPEDPVDGLRWGFDRYVEFGLAHPLPYRLLFDRPGRGPAPNGTAVLDRLRRGMQKVADEGRLRVPVEDALLAFWSSMHGVTSLAILGALPRDARAIREVREAILAQLTR